MTSLVAVIMLLSQYKPSFAVFLTILVIPGITTSSLTVFNKISEGPNVGVFGPAALFPALALIFGIWLRILYRKEKIAPNPLIKILLFFVGISAISALSALWRYSNFWPFNIFTNPVLNIKGDLFSSTYLKIIWTFVNYFTGPFLLLAICQAAWLSRQRKENFFCARKWILFFIVLPVFIGCVAVFYVGWKQTVNIWFGANKFYVWPWVNRINATFFDPNALGSFVILIVPWILASIFLVASFRRWLAFPGIIFAGFLLWRCGTLMSHSGSRISILGIIVISMVTIIFGLFLILKRIKSKILFRISTAIVFLLYFSGSIWIFYYSPKIINNLEKKAVFKKSSLFERVKKLPLGSFKGIYKQVMKDRGSYAKLAVSMIKNLPLTGVGLGCFIIEHDNWKNKNKVLIYVPDTACNYYLQIFSEQGIIGLITILIFFGLWWKVLYKVWQTNQASGFWFFIGAGVVAMIVIFIFGMHTLAHEIQCLFWIFLCQPVIAYKSNKNKHTESNKYLYILFFVVGIVYFCQAFSYLSLDKQKEKFGWKTYEGFYKWENWSKSRIRHTRKEAKETLVCKGLVLQQEWACLHPNITSSPVMVTFNLNNVSTNFIVSDNEWKQLDINVSFKDFNKSIEHKIKTSRTWAGKEFNINDDKRKFGVTLKKTKWLNKNGLYDTEIWSNDESIAAGKEYNWTKKSIRTFIKQELPYLDFSLMVSRPDITQSPVKVSIKIDNQLIGKIVLTNSHWYNNVFFVQPFLMSDPHWYNNVFFVQPFLMSDSPNKKLCLALDVSRTWIPTNYGFEDKRQLGVALVKPEQKKDFGFYHIEKWKDDFKYKWAGEKARWAQKTDKSGNLIVNYLISNPDISDFPVTWTLCVSNEEVYKQTITNNGWRKIVLKRESNSWYDIKAEVNQTWFPVYFGSKDNRELGFAIKF